MYTPLMIWYVLEDLGLKIMGRLQPRMMKTSSPK